MHQDQQAVRDVLDAQALAIHAKDPRAAIATYSDDVTVYDLAPPLVQSAEMVRDPSNGSRHGMGRSTSKRPTRQSRLKVTSQLRGRCAI